MRVEIINSYKFLSLSKNDCELLQKDLKNLTANLDLKGTILLSEEGINIALSGLSENIAAFATQFQKDMRFADMIFKTSHADSTPFDVMKIKIKPEIITFGVPESSPLKKTAPAVSPGQFKQWLDENREMTILDARNHYECAVGTFENAIDLGIDEFTQFPQKAAEFAESLSSEEKIKPIVTFCTGGVRCEKAAHVLSDLGFENVYQLDGGILRYFEVCGGAYYNGNCFVFDQRLAVNSKLEPV